MHFELPQEINEFGAIRFLTRITLRKNLETESLKVYRLKNCATDCNETSREERSNEIVRITLR